MVGTFTAKPDIFEQLYTIHNKVHDEFMPRLWCLLPNKQMNTYLRLFQLLKTEAARVRRQLNPTVIHTDIEMAVIGAVRAEFGIEPSADVRKTVRRLMSLPLVPPLRIDQAFHFVANRAPNVLGLDVLINYVSGTYIDQQTAQFDRTIWNCFGMADRTTNSCEAYRRVLNEYFHHRHPDPFKFVQFLQSQEMEFERRHEQLQVGAPARKRKPMYLHIDEALRRLRETYFGAGIPSIANVVTCMDAAVAHQLYDVKHLTF
jgi:hypothetical protein